MATPLGGTVLVTGAAGFIRSHASAAPVGHGLRGVGVDNFDPFYGRAATPRNVDEIGGAGGSDGFRLLEADIRDAAAMDRLFAEVRPQTVIHLAAKAGVRPSIADPAGYTSVNVLGTSVLLEAARKAGVARF